MNRPYSEATIDLVAWATEQHHIVAGETDAMGNNPCVCGQWWDAAGDNPGWDQHMAEVALDALAEACLLLPEGADDENFSWGVRNDEGWVHQCGDRLDAESLIAARVKLSPHDPPGGLVRRRWAATWEPVDAVRLAEGDSKAVQDPSVSVEETPQ